jgi:endonuclease YncB( thermonuclease family)
MRTKWFAVGGFLGLLIVGAALSPAFGGDSLWGKVTQVKSANLVVLDYGNGEPDRTYDIRLVGIDAPREGAFARQAREFVSRLVLGKNARMRLVGKAKNGEMVARLTTDDPVVGIKDVGVELVRAGLARKAKGYDYKYDELAAAEIEAQSAKRGLWATAQPQ